MKLLTRILGTSGALALTGFIAVAPAAALDHAPATAQVLSTQSGTAAEGNRIDQMNEEIHIYQNGDIKITQTATVSTVGEFSGISQTFDLKAMSGIPDTTVIRDVTSMINDQPARVELNQVGQKTTISATDAQPLSGGTHTVIIEYTLRDAFVQTKDGYQFLWDLTGTNWGIPINNVSVTYTKDEDLDIRFARFYFNEGIYSPPEATDETLVGSEVSVATFEFASDPLSTSFVTGADVSGINSESIRSGDSEANPVITFAENDIPDNLGSEDLEPFEIIMLMLVICGGLLFLLALISAVA